MPKTTVHGGPSNAAERPGEGTFFKNENQIATQEEEVRPSAGTSSSASSLKTGPSSDSSATARPKPVQTTASHSKQHPAGNSTAHAATSSGRKTGTE